MRNRTAVLKKIDQIESTINRVTSSISRGDKEAYNAALGILREQLDQLKTYVDSEPITGNELNP